MGYIEVARRGFDLEKASDSDKLFSSRYPSLLIKDRITAQLTTDGALLPSQYHKLHTHGLGYEPVFWAWDNYIQSSPVRSEGTSEDMHPSKWVSVDENFVYFKKPTNNTLTIDVLIYIFYRPIFTEYTAKNFSPFGSGTAKSGGAFMKITRLGKDIGARDLRDYVIHPDTKTLMVHKSGSVNNPSDGTGTFTITHDMRYQPMHFVYYKASVGGSSGKTEHIYFLPNSSSPYTPGVTNSTMEVVTTSAGDYAYLIMKDPIK